MCYELWGLWLLPTESIEILPCPDWFPGTCFIFFLLFPRIEKQNMRSSELGETSDNLVPPWFCPWASNRPDWVPPLMMVLKREGSWNWVKVRMLLNSTNISWVIILAYQPRGRETRATMKAGKMAGSLIMERVWKKSMRREREHWVTMKKSKKLGPGGTRQSTWGSKPRMLGLGQTVQWHRENAATKMPCSVSITWLISSSPLWSPEASNLMFHSPNLNKNHTHNFSHLWAVKPRILAFSGACMSSSFRK